MFDNQLDILKYLIQQRLFAPSPSALAAKLGYKGRTTLYRLLNNTVKTTLSDKYGRTFAKFSAYRTNEWQKSPSSPKKANGYVI